MKIGLSKTIIIIIIIDIPFMLLIYVKLSFFHFYQIFSLVNKYYHKSYCRRYSRRPRSVCYITALMYGQEGTSAVASCYVSVCGLYVGGLTDRHIQSDGRCMLWRSKIEEEWGDCSDSAASLLAPYTVAESLGRTFAARRTRNRKATIVLIVMYWHSSRTAR